MLGSAESTESEKAEVRRLSRRAAEAQDQPIAQLMQAALDRPHLISLAAGFVDNTTLPRDIMQRALQAVLSGPEVAQQSLQYGLCAGDLELRKQIAERYFDETDLADAMLLTPGSNQLLHLLIESLLDPGEIVLTASPTYFVFLAAVEDCGGRAWGVETDELGVTPQGLEAALDAIEARGERRRVKCLYLVPDFDNPSAKTMTTARREAILDVLQRRDPEGTITLIVDNAYRELRYEGETPATFRSLGIRSELTVETGTFSKNFSPGVRVGWGVLPAHLYLSVLRRKSVIDFGSPHFNQVVVRHVIEAGLLDQHLQTLRASYSIKRDAMDEAVKRYILPIDGTAAPRPKGGLYQWLTLPAEINTDSGSPLWRAALESGVLYVPGCYCYPGEGAPVNRATIRLTFGVQAPERITEGVKRLGEAIRYVAG